MYVNPFPFGIVVGVVGTILVEIVILVVAVCTRSKKK